MSFVSFSLTFDHSLGDKIDIASQVVDADLSDVSAEDWFVNCVKDRRVEPKATMTESDDNRTRILTDQINCVVHAINSLRFKERHVL